MKARKALAAMEAAGGTVEVKEVADWSAGGPDPGHAERLRHGSRRPGAGREKRPYPPQWLAQVKNPLMLVLY